MAVRWTAILVTRKCEAAAGACCPSMDASADASDLEYRWARFDFIASGSTFLY